MNRRDFLLSAGAITLGMALPSPAWAVDRHRLLILVELKGGHDGLNTVIPYSAPLYSALRPNLALKQDQIIPISGQAALHPALAPLLPIWESKELAILQGVGYPQPNLSHFRSIEIWDTASSSSQYLDDGWLSRAIGSAPHTKFAAEGIIVGSGNAGPLSGGRSRTLALSSPEVFLRQARREHETTTLASSNPALAHVLKVQADIQQAAFGLQHLSATRTTFPEHEFGQACRACAQLAATANATPVIKLALAGFDTHANQAATLSNLLGQLAGGLSALRQALQETDRWQDTLILTYGEFGRRPAENASMGTDHGTANVHFALGGNVMGGLHGQMPALSRLENGNLIHTVDFRSLYATVLERHWGMKSRGILTGQHTPLEFMKPAE